MADTDFFDDDLDVNKEVEAPSASSDSSSTPPPLNDLTRQRDHVEGQVASTARDIELLRQRQEGLEREKRELETLRRRQDEYEASKSKMQHQLRQSLLALEKEEIRSVQLVTLYGNTRTSFQKMMTELEAIDETLWAENELKDELDRAQLVVDSIRVESSKELAKIDAVVSEGRTPEVQAEALAPVATEKKHPRFGYWMMVGVAIAIPLLIALTGAGLLEQWILSFFSK